VSPLVNEKRRGALSMPDGDCGGDVPEIPDDGGDLVMFIPIPGGLRTPAALLSYHQWYLGLAISCGVDILY